MQVRTLFLVAAAMLVGWVARGAQPTPEALAAPPAPAPRIVYVTAPAAPLPPPERDDVEEEDAGEDLGEVLARAQHQVPPPPPELPHNMIEGRCIDPASGEATPGVTVVATGPTLEGAQTAITDESGDYVIRNLPVGSYRVTFYYTDVTVEDEGVAVSSLSSSLLDQKIGPGSYIKPIPTGRTFEADTSDLGLTFSGTTSLENTYYVDGVQ